MTGTMPFGCWAVLMFPIGFFGYRMISAALDAMTEGDSEQATLMGAVGAVLLMVAVAVTAGTAVQSYRGRELAAALARSDPEPWRYHPAWKDGRVQHTGTHRAIEKGVFALFWNAIAWPVALLTVPPRDAMADPAAMLFYLFPLIGVALAVRTAGAVWHRLRFGRTVLTLDTFPGEIGGRFAGTLVTRFPSSQQPPGGFKVTLTCVRERFRPGKGNNSTTRRPLWLHTHQVAGVPYSTREGTFLGVPVAFDLATHPPPTTLHATEDKVYWELSVTTEGQPRFSVDMKVPVFDLRDEVEKEEELLELLAPLEAPAGGDGDALADVEIADPGGAAMPGVERVPLPAPVPADVAEPSVWRQLLNPPAPSFAVDHLRDGSTVISQARGAARPAMLSAALAGVAVLAAIAVFDTPAGQEGLVFLLLAIGGLFTFGAIRSRPAATSIRLARHDLRVERNGVGGDRVVNLIYDDLISAKIIEVSRVTSSSNGRVKSETITYDVEIHSTRGGKHRLGLRVTDERQAQAIAVMIDRRITPREVAAA